MFFYKSSPQRERSSASYFSLIRPAIFPAFSKFWAIIAFCKLLNSSVSQGSLRWFWQKPQMGTYWLIILKSLSNTGSVRVWSRNSCGLIRTRSFSDLSWLSLVLLHSQAGSVFVCLFIFIFSGLILKFHSRRLFIFSAFFKASVCDSWEFYRVGPLPQTVWHLDLLLTNRVTRASHLSC